MTITKKNIRNIFIYTFPKFASYGLNLITLPILTRILTPEDFGIVAFAGIFPIVLVSIATLGITFGVERYYFEYRKDNQKLNALIFSSQLFLYSLLIISSGMFFIFKDFFSKIIMGNAKYGSVLFIGFLSAYFNHIIMFYLRLYQNMERATIHAVFTIMQAFAVSLISLLLVWYFKLSYMGMLYGSLAGAIIISLALLFYFNRNTIAIFNIRILFENIKYGLQLVPKSFTGFINRFFDKYMLNNMLSLSAVGIYNIGQGIGNAVVLLMNSATSSFQPVYYKEVFDKGQSASTTVGRIFTIFSYITLFPVLLLILFSQEIIYIIAPLSYYKAIDIIIIISGGIAAQVFGMYIGVQYAYSKKAYWIFPVTVIGTISNVIANIILIPKFGLIGASIATVISASVANCLLIYIGQRLYTINYEWKTISSLFGNIIAAIFAILYFRKIDNMILLYFSKLLFLMVVILIGIKSGILTKTSFQKVVNALFGFSKLRKVNEVT